MNWKNGGYKECKKCGNLFKAKTNAQYCKKCSPKYEPVEKKTIVCKDCGKEVIIRGVAKNKCRCDDCQSIRDKKMKSERNAKYYLSHKD